MGVSIAVFNQVSRIAIFPLVSITTSFVAEEDVLGRWTNEVPENENLEKGLAMDNEMEELITHRGKHSKYSLFFAVGTSYCYAWFLDYSHYLKHAFNS